MERCARNGGRRGVLRNDGGDGSRLSTRARARSCGSTRRRRESSGSRSRIADPMARSTVAVMSGVGGWCGCDRGRRSRCARFHRGAGIRGRDAGSADGDAEGRDALCLRASVAVRPHARQMLAIACVAVTACERERRPFHDSHTEGAAESDTTGALRPVGTQAAMRRGASHTATMRTRRTMGSGCTSRTTARDATRTAAAGWGRRSWTRRGSTESSRRTSTRRSRRDVRMVCRRSRADSADTRSGSSSRTCAQ